jgi:hypothetical protein
MATWMATRVGGDGDTETAYFDSWNSTGAADSLWTVPPSGMTESEQLFDWQTYQRGAMTYEALKTAIGDFAFFSLVKEWQHSYSGTTQNWTDFIDLAEEISGHDLTAFFQDWIYDADKPAWPGRIHVSLSATPGTESVPAGSQLTFGLGATNVGKTTVSGAVISVDLSHVLDHATIGALPPGVSLAGTTLSWAVPTTSWPDFVGTSFPVTVRGDAQGSTLVATTSVPLLVGTCRGQCTVTTTVGPPAPQPPVKAVGTECGVTLKGKAVVGRTLKAKVRGCPAGAVLTYRWFTGATAITGADDATYQLKRSKRGKKIKVQVTVAAPGYTSAVRTSAPTPKVH